MCRVRGVYNLVNAQEEAWRVQGTREGFAGMITAVETVWLGMGLERGDRNMSWVVSAGAMVEPRSETGTSDKWRMGVFRG